MYYTVIKYSKHLKTLEKCWKHSQVTLVFYSSLVFSNARHVLSQCNTRLRLLYLLNKTHEIMNVNFITFIFYILNILFFSSNIGTTLITSEFGLLTIYLAMFSNWRFKFTIVLIAVVILFIPKIINIKLLKLPGYKCKLRLLWWWTSQHQ